MHCNMIPWGNSEGVKDGEHKTSAESATGDRFGARGGAMQVVLVSDWEDSA